MGFALKAASPSAGTDWSDVRDELSKAPQLPAHLPYTLVLWSLNLAPQLQGALGSGNSAAFEQSKWQLHGSALVKAMMNPATRPVFEVGVAQELVVANPHPPSGGGLEELLGTRLLEKVRSTTSRTRGLSIPHLTDWMPVLQTAMQQSDAAR